MENIGGSCVESRVDAVKIDSAFSNPERALTVPRRTGEQETTSGNCLLTRMISLGLGMPSNKAAAGGFFGALRATMRGL